MRATWWVLLTLVTGCDGIELERLLPSHEARTRIRPEPPGEHCSQGGQAVLSGVDLDDSGVLDDAEVTATEYACTMVLSRVQPEAEGPHCAHGGQAVRSGADMDGDGVLDDAEVTATEYVCASAIPDVLVRSRPVSPGERCPLGGQVFHAGRDTDGDGLLSAPEITREAYGCTESVAVLTRVTPLTEAPFVCQQASSIVDAGPDLDGDGVLGGAEERATLRVCVPPDKVKLRQSPEPAGTRCPSGGTVVEAGRDMDGDGMLSHNEALAETYVCQPTAIYNGTYQVRNAADLAALEAISHIRGGLDLSHSELQDVVLPGLISVGGALTILDNASLTRVDLLGLRFVGTAINVSRNPELKLLQLGASGPMPEVPLRVGTDLTLEDNAKLDGLFGLLAVEPRRTVTLARNASLMSGDPFPFIQELSGDLNITGNASLRGLSFGKLRAVAGSVDLYGNASLSSLAGLELLTNVGQDFFLADNDSLTSLSGLSRLERVGRTLHVAGNDGLYTVSLDSLKHAGVLRLESNPQLETVGPMPSLESVEGMFSITLHSNLVAVTDFPRLLSVGEGLNVADNALLTDLSAFGQVARMRYLWVMRNGALASLAHLGGLYEVGEMFVQENPSLTQLSLTRLTRVSTAFTVTDNPKLPGCLATSLADAAYQGTAEQRDIARNDEATACTP